MSEIQAVGKTGRNISQNYNFRGIDAVVNAVGPAFRNHGLVCLPTLVGSTEETVATAKGGTMKVVTLDVEYTIYGPAGDSLTGTVRGEAADVGDKATPKAFSVAYRTFLLQTLCIPTDEKDPDEASYVRAHTPPKVTEEALFTQLKAQIERAPTLAALRTAWEILDGAHQEGKVSDVDRASLTALTGARKAELEHEGTQELHPREDASPS